MPWLDALWHPGRWIEGPTVPFDPADRGLLLGDGVFDTSLVLGGTMVWRDAHLRRLAAHAAAIGITVGAERLDAAVDGTLASMAGAHGALRITVTRGPGPRGLVPPANQTPTILITTAPLAANALFRPVALYPAPMPRNESSPLSRLKSLNYGDAVAAAGAARDAGCDDALFVNTAGRVACAGTANIFALFGRHLVTPPLQDGTLDGVARAVLLDGAASEGFLAGERPLGRDDLAGADAVFCTSSLRLIAPVSGKDARSSKALEAIMARSVEAASGLDPRALRCPEDHA